MNFPIFNRLKNDNLFQDKTETKMNELVDKIIAQKQKGEGTKAIENLIDKMVYELYYITTDEQKLIEGK